MLIISARDNKNNRQKREAAKTKTERNKRGNTNYSESVRPTWFCCAFKLGFLQVICQASLIFKSNLGLALSITLKKGQLYQSKQVVMECSCLKIWDLLSFFICSSILVLK